MSINKVILVGNVGRDPEVRYVEKKPLISLSLATTDPARKTADGATVPEHTEWHRVVLWGALAEYAEKYVRRGTRLYVEGKLRTRVWEDRNTIKHSVTEIVADTIEILGRVTT